MSQQLLNEYDVYLFNNGSLEQAWRLLGVNPLQCNGEDGLLFAVWAPNASRVALVGDFNHWDGCVDVMTPQGDSGIWALFKTNIVSGARYKFELHNQAGQLLPLKADPYAKQMECPPANASVVPVFSSYQWQDQAWLSARAQHLSHKQALSIYEVHAGSWRRGDGNQYLSYRQLAAELLPYVKGLGFTHVQLMPISEFPFDGSWGYQPLGMFAASARFGSADDFKYFVDCAHQQGLGVLLDWVPGHFPTDSHGLANFDGSHLYEHADPRQGFHPDWNTCIYNYGRAEVQSYLLSNAMYWLEEFHIDGLRFDAVASMLYLDYSRKAGEWVPNEHGGRENLAALAFLRLVNQRAYQRFPGILMAAEESTAWPGVTQFLEHGGLGFGYKWNMGWMNDSLRYLSREPIHRKFHHAEMTFSLLYAFSENFILPLSHDEVVHGKRSIIERVPGDDWQKFASLRCYLSFMWLHPGKKLLFMGTEFAQRSEWNHNSSLDWNLLQYASHQGVQQLIRDLNALYRHYSALHEDENQSSCFAWINADDHEHSIFSFWRYDAHGHAVLVLCNFTPMPHQHFTVGVPSAGYYRELLNSDSTYYAGSGLGNGGGVHSQAAPYHGQPHSLTVVVPPLATVVFSKDLS